MKTQKAKIQELRSAEIAAETRGDVDLLIQLKEERLLLELEVVRFAKSNDKKEVIFKPQHFSKIKKVSMEKVGLDYIPFIKGAYNVLAGTGGSGKSAIALKSMLMWLNCNPNKKGLAFFTEDGISEIENRVKIICENSNLNYNLIDRIDFICLDNDDRIKLVEKSRNGYDINENYISSVIDYCKTNKIEYIILDPLKRFHSLDENSNSEIDILVRNVFTRIAVETNSVLLVLHHSTKGTGNARGASTITDSARVAWSIGRYFIKDGDGKIIENLEKKGLVRLEIIKDNLGIENLCKIRSETDKSIINPLLSRFNNKNIPIVTEFINDKDFFDIIS